MPSRLSCAGGCHALAVTGDDVRKRTAHAYDEVVDDYVRRTTDVPPWPEDPATRTPTTGLRRWFVHHRPDELVGLLTDAGFVVHLTRERESHRRWLQVLAGRSDPGQVPPAADRTSSRQAESLGQRRTR